MPVLDPNIPLSVRPAKLPSVADIYAQQASLKNLGIQQEQEQARTANIQAQTAAREQDTAAQQRAAEVQQAASDAYAQIKGGNAEHVLSTLQPNVRAIAEGWLGDFAKSKKARDDQSLADAKRAAQFIQAADYNPVVAATSIQLLADIYPEAKEMLQHVNSPDALKTVVDHFATFGDAPRPGYTLNPGDTRYDANNQQVATGGEKVATPPNVGSFEDYVLRTYGDKPTSDQILAARKAYQQADDRPPASIQIHNMLEAEGSPTFNAARPDPATGNKAAKELGGWSPNSIYQAALEYAATGRYPSIGFGQSINATKVRNAIAGQAAAIADAAGVDLYAVRADMKAQSATLSRLMPQYKATMTFANAATDNLDLALEQSDDVARTGAKLANRYIQWAQGELTPAKGLTKFETYVYTAAREYAKVTSGGAASAQGLTDSAQREASKLLNTAQSPEAFRAAVEAMKADMGNVTAEQTKTLAGVSSNIANFFSAANGGPPVAAGQPAQPAASPDAGWIDLGGGVRVRAK